MAKTKSVCGVIQLQGGNCSLYAAYLLLNSFLQLLVLFFKYVFACLVAGKDLCAGYQPNISHHDSSAIYHHNQQLHSYW